MNFNTVNFQKNIPIKAQKAKRVVIIDNFSEKSLKIITSIGGYWDENKSHGEIVEKIILEKLPEEYEVERCDCYNGDKNLDDKKVNHCLEKIIVEAEKGNAPIAVNMSFGENIPYETVSKRLNKNITADNIAEYKMQIKDMLNNSSDPNEKLYSIQIKNMERLASKGIKMYVSAGNQTIEEEGKLFNVITLAEGIKTVGATNNDGNLASYSVNNSLVNDKEVGTFEIKRITDKKGKTGCDITGDGSIDVYMNGSYNFLKFCNSRLFGTSYATPKALVRDLTIQTQKASQEVHQERLQ